VSKSDSEGMPYTAQTSLRTRACSMMVLRHLLSAVQVVLQVAAKQQKTASCFTALLS
jgi:hypothetical protein